MKCFFDNNLPPRLAKAINSLEGEGTVFHLLERFDKEVKDVEWINKLAKRTRILQLKDMVIFDTRQTMCEVMSGNMNWEGILAAAKAARIEYLMVDQDECYGKDPFECLRVSMSNIKESGLI